MSSQDSVDPRAVLIVGAGPTGLALALTLLKSGIPVRIINKAPTNHQEQRGMGIQPRTLEVFHFLGTLPEMMEKACQIETIRSYKMHPFTQPKTTRLRSLMYNNVKSWAQYHTESILRSHIQKYGCSVELATELISFKQHDDSVDAVIKKSVDGKETTETKSYRWLVGADGGKSTVRKQCGLSFDGSSAHENWVVGETYIEGLDPTVLHWYNWLKEDGSMEKRVFLRNIESEPGRYHFSIAGDIDSDKLMTDHEYLKDTLRTLSERSDLLFGNILYVTAYRPSVRMVNKLSVGRVFVAGDAAHVHTPRGGQGLNSSVQDAFNLGWKLVLVEKGLAPQALLETYNEERLPVIKCMLQETVKVTKRYSIADNVKKSSSGLANPAYLKQLGINYRWSSIVLDERVLGKPKGEDMDPYGANSDDAPCAGDRAPNATGLVRVEGASLADSQVTSLFDNLSPTRHTALIFGEDASHIASIVRGLSVCPPSTVTSVAILPSGTVARAVDGVDVALQDRDGTAYDGYRMVKEKTFAVIVRPDGVVGAVVSGFEGVVKYFGGIFSGLATV